MAQAPQRVPLAFIDRSGYVTPFNSIMDKTLDGWYIYDQEVLDKALAQQRALEDQRVETEIGIIDVQYSVEDVEEKELPSQEIQQLLGMEQTIPFLNLANGSGVTEDGEPVTPVPKSEQRKDNTMTEKHFHQEPDNVNLSDDELEELGKQGLSPTAVLNAVMG